ncbi:hypothetical protein Kpho02_76250 [Kitasatospora phosalacinea]|uniref:Uncharacterized protein n=1 Tax=Kitasatospora phosalacinea TaxID=2065 RepID=A0A9W6QI24_9ACTN|nr:hypothetical protein Kpho02_76250 [Kitasatospora phosalacinea]
MQEAPAGGNRPGLSWSTPASKGLTVLDATPKIPPITPADLAKAGKAAGRLLGALLKGGQK